MPLIRTATRVFDYLASLLNVKRHQPSDSFFRNPPALVVVTLSCSRSSPPAAMAFSAQVLTARAVEHMSTDMIATVESLLSVLAALSGEDWSTGAEVAGRDFIQPGQSRPVPRTPAAAIRTTTPITMKATGDFFFGGTGGMPGQGWPHGCCGGGPYW